MMIDNNNEIKKICKDGENKKNRFLKTSIDLEDIEEKLFSLLVRASDWYANDSTSSSNSSNDTSSATKLELRVAGGWVRDKLLGLHSHDVDIAVDKMSGVEFCQIVLQYLEHLQESGKGVEINAEHHYKMSVINANPEQSKHLETATMKILGIDIDFVNLRAEELYLPHSRIPHQTTKFGTPLEDALRRDLTINALFYNLTTKEIEDCTNRGLEDLLVKKLVVTPLDPHSTFHDDPLRVLRAVKFAVRFGFDIAFDLREAALSPAVHQSLLLKVSRERVGKELSAMLIGKNADPVKALTLLSELGLAQPVFGLPEGQLLEGSILNTPYKDTPDPVLTVSSHDNLFDQAWPHASFCISLLPLFSQHLKIVDPAIIHLSVFLFPFSDLSFKDKKKKEITLIVWMLREGLKFKNKDVAALQTIFDHLSTMRSYLNNSHGNSNTPPSRLQLGLVLRQLKDLWLITLILATIAEIHYPFFQNNNTTLPSLESYAKSNLFNTNKDKCISSFKNMLTLVTATYNLDKCWTIPPLINGKELLSLLHIHKGPIVGTYLHHQIEWMLSHPNGHKDECIDYLKELRGRRNVDGLDDVKMRSVEKKKNKSSKDSGKRRIH